MLMAGIGDPYARGGGGCLYQGSLPQIESERLREGGDRDVLFSPTA
jgi:hypothetical protein